MSMATKKKIASKKKNTRYFLDSKPDEELVGKLVNEPTNSEDNETVEEGDKRKKRKVEEIIKLKPKKLHKEKKIVTSQLKNLHDLLNSNRPPDDEELGLEHNVFGGDTEIFDNEDSENDEIYENDEDTENEGEESSIKESEVKIVKKKPAWVDEDDDNYLVKNKVETIKNCHRSFIARGEEKYSHYLADQFKKAYGEPMSKSKVVDSDGESEEELQKTGNFIKESEPLSKNTINIRKCASLTHENMKDAIVKSVEFHPTSRVALVSGTNGIVNLFQVDGKLNSLIQSIYIESFPIHTAHFTVDGSNIVAGSNQHGYFYTYDMYMGKVVRIPWQKGMEQKNIRRFQMSPDGKYIVIHGRYGNIHLVTTKTKEWIGSLKMNGEVVAICFSKDGTKLYSHGECGEVYVWDLNTRKCILKFTDEGCITGTSIDISPNDQFLATGSDSGIVNIYDCSTLNSSSPSPVKVLKNLTTEITALKFNATTEVLAMGSSYKIGAARLVHFPSLSVFSNFPSPQDYKAIKHVNTIDISPNSGFMLMGNNTGNALLYRLKHYKNY